MVDLQHSQFCPREPKANKTVFDSWLPHNIVKDAFIAARIIHREPYPSAISASYVLAVVVDEIYRVTNRFQLFVGSSRNLPTRASPVCFFRRRPQREECV